MQVPERRLGGGDWRLVRGGAERVPGFGPGFELGGIGAIIGGQKRSVTKT